MDIYQKVEQLQLSRGIACTSNAAEGVDHARLVVIDVAQVGVLGVTVVARALELVVLVRPEGERHRSEPSGESEGP